MPHDDNCDETGYWAGGRQSHFARSPLRVDASLGHSLYLSLQPRDGKEHLLLCSWVSTDESARGFEKAVGIVAVGTMPIWVAECQAQEPEMSAAESSGRSAGGVLTMLVSTMSPLTWVDTHLLQTVKQTGVEQAIEDPR